MNEYLHMHGCRVWIINSERTFKFDNCVNFIAFEIFTPRRKNRSYEPEKL